MSNQKEIGLEILYLSKMIKRRAEQVAFKGANQHLSSSQALIIHYIGDQDEDTDIFQRDIENEFSLSRSTVSELLSTMQKNDLIRRESVQTDGRLKKLTLTSKAQKLYGSIHEQFNLFEQQLSEGLTEEELDYLFSIFNKLKQRLK